MKWLGQCLCSQRLASRQTARDTLGRRGSNNIILYKCRNLAKWRAINRETPFRLRNFQYAIVAIWSFNRRFRYTNDRRRRRHRGRQAIARPTGVSIAPLNRLQVIDIVGDRPSDDISVWSCLPTLYILILTIDRRDEKRCNSILLITLRSQSCGNSVAVLWSLSRFKSISWPLLIPSLPPLRRMICVEVLAQRNREWTLRLLPLQLLLPDWLNTRRFPHDLTSQVRQLLIDTSIGFVGNYRNYSWSVWVLLLHLQSRNIFPFRGRTGKEVAVQIICGTGTFA